jgi:hypothetical protein
MRLDSLYLPERFTFSTKQDAEECIAVAVASNSVPASDPDIEEVDILEDDGILLETPRTTLSSLQGRTGGPTPSAMCALLQLSKI